MERMNTFKDIFKKSFLEGYAGSEITLVTIVALYILGVDSIREFTFPLIIGMLAGVYSSVMLSGQIWAHWIDHKTFAPIINLFKGKKAKKA